MLSLLALLFGLQLPGRSGGYQGKGSFVSTVHNDPKNSARRISERLMTLFGATKSSIAEYLLRWVSSRESGRYTEFDMYERRGAISTRVGATKFGCPFRLLKVSDRAQKARRNGPELAPSPSRGLSKGQKAFLCQHGFIFFDSSPVHFIRVRQLI